MHFFVSFLVGVVFFYLFFYFPFSAAYLTAKKKYFLIFISDVPLKKPNTTP